MHVAIVGLGPSSLNYVQIAEGHGGRHRFCDETWVVNYFGDVLEHDKVFHMDDVRIQQVRAEASPDSKVSNMLDWMKNHPGPILTSRAHPDYPGLVEYPLEEVINKCGSDYFNNTISYAIAYAIYMDVEKISMFGADFTYPDMAFAERGRGCCEYWLGNAAQRGIEIQVSHKSSLLDAVLPPEERHYGYDTVKLDLSYREDGSVQVLKTPHDELPTAEEIEKRYDHSGKRNE